MRVGPVVEDVAEQVDGRPPDGLREEEVVRHEGDAGAEVGGDGVGGGAGDHVGEVLDDEVEVRVGLGEGDADVAAGAADVDDGALIVGGGGGGVVVVGIDVTVDGSVVVSMAVIVVAIIGVAVDGGVVVIVVVVVVVVVVVGVAGDGRPGVAFGQEAGRKAEAIREGGHGAREAFGHVRVRGVVLPHWLVGMLRQAPTGFVGLIALELLHRLDGVRERLPHFVEHVPEAGFGVGVFGELA